MEGAPFENAPDLPGPPVSGIQLERASQIRNSSSL